MRHHAQGVVCYVRVEIHALVTPKPQVLAAFLEQHLDVPTDLVKLEGPDELHVRVGGDEHVPRGIPPNPYEDELYVCLPHHRPLLEVQAPVLAALRGLAPVQGNEFVHVVFPFPHGVLLVARLHAADEVDAALAYLPQRGDHAFRHEPGIHKRIGQPYALAPCAPYHPERRVGLLGVELVEALVVGIAFVALFAELHLPLPPAEAAFPAAPPFPVQGQVAGVGASAVEYGKDKQLKAGDEGVPDVVEDSAQALDAEAGLRFRRVVHDVALVVQRLFRPVLPDDGAETAGHAQEDHAPVHFRPVQESVVAVLAGLDQIMETFLMHCADGLLVDAEEDERQEQLDHVHAAPLRKRMFGQHPSKGELAKKGEYRLVCFTFNT